MNPDGLRPVGVEEGFVREGAGAEILMVAPSSGKIGMIQKNRLISSIVESLSATGRIVFQTSALRPSITGELEEDRFAYRIDVEAAWERGIRTVDTTHGASYPVAEWALGHVPTVRVCAWERAVRYETPKRRDTGDAGLRRPPITQP